MVKTRRDVILATVGDLVSNFMYYDRKEDEDLPRGAGKLTGFQRTTREHIENPPPPKNAG